MDELANPPQNVETSETSETLPHWADAIRAAGAHLIRWAVSNPAVALTGCTVVGFVYLRLCLNRYYAAFRVSPEDVGLGYKETFTSAVAFVVLTLVVVAGVAFAVHMLGVGRVWRIAFVSVFAIGFFSGFFYNAGVAGRHAAEGQRTPWWFRQMLPEPQIANVSAATATTGLPYDIADSVGTCLLFVGSAKGLDVFYRPRDHVAIRVPSTLVTVDVGALSEQGFATCPGR